MPEFSQNQYSHLFLHGTSTATSFTAHQARGTPHKELPDLPRQSHGTNLIHQIERLKPLAEHAARIQKEVGFESGFGLQIEFESQPHIRLAFESLANERAKDSKKKIELLSVREEGDHTYANVFVPDGKLQHFERYITDYLQEKTDKNGKPRDHKPLLNTIQSIRSAQVRSLWTDDPDQLPGDSSESFWWEVWLPVRGDRSAVIDDFKRFAGLAGCDVGQHYVSFPERTVMLMHGSEQQLSSSILTLNCIAELRRAKETAFFFDDMPVEEQRQWTDELLTRAVFPDEGNETPRVCLLDSGVNRGHPLLEPLLSSADLHTLDPSGRKDDTANHGTGMAGLAAYGDLTDALSTSNPLNIRHRLESVRLIADSEDNHGSPNFHAQLFAEACSYPEVTHPHRPRVFCSAVTATDYRDRGRPSSWSAEVDSLAADAGNTGQFPRLFILSAGNTDDGHAWTNYPSSLSTNLIHDPGQSWNALTVGACTFKTNTENSSCTPVASEGGLSPYTTTSATWDNGWPLKPEVVFEGGNVGQDSVSAWGMHSLSLLTTNNLPQERLLTTFNATSSASALCAKLACEIWANYPRARPETVRALIIHSAEWTDAMRGEYLPSALPKKSDYVNLIRHCGWGQPDLNRALWSAQNSLTLVIEDVLQPYKKHGGSIRTRDMHLHSLPWPREELEALQEAQVEMRVTLSYFIEPNPSARGIKSKYHYTSHRLRFDVQHPLDSSTDDFIARLNAEAAQEDEGGSEGNNPDPNWHLGPRQRHRGSLHQDIWEGTAAQLADRGFIAVYPAQGWWRTRPAKERYDLPVRYSLVVSIKTEEKEVDLYNAVTQQVAIET